MKKEDALKILRELYDKALFSERTALETLHPELKESEDEKVRETLVELIKCNERCGYFLINNVTTSSMLAWLEKQGEHKKFRDSIQAGDEVTRNRDGAIVNLSQLNRVAEKDEKQGTSYTKRDVDDAFVEGMAFAKNELEKQGKQKPSDKVEPKFHEGDWVVISTTKGDRVVQIASVEYLKDGYPSYITTEGRWFGNGTKARLLTDKDVETITIPESKIVVKKKE